MGVMLTIVWENVGDIHSAANASRFKGRLHDCERERRGKQTGWLVDWENFPNCVEERPLTGHVGVAQPSNIVVTDGRSSIGLFLETHT